MFQFRKSFLILLIIAVCFSSSFAVEDNVLPKSLTDAERDYISNNYEEYLQSKTIRDRSAFRLPQGDFYGPAEFEPSDGVIFSWKGYTTLLKKLIKFVAEDYQVWVIAGSSGSWWGGSSVSEVESELQSYGVNMDNVNTIDYVLDSVWIRDFGPWWIYTEDGNREVIDFKYNRPRPNDDKLPAKMAEVLDVGHYETDLIMAGGNFMLDGNGVAIMTDVVFDPSQGGMPNMSVAELEKYMDELFNVDKVIILEQMKRDGTGHVDMFSKLLNDKTILVGEYASPSDGAEDNYDILNRNAELLANETNGNGESFNVVRIPMPKYTGTSYSYTNSLIVNDKVLVPVYGFDMDEEALDIYRENLPGYDVRGFDSSNIIGANGAIHCITKLVMSDPINIRAHDIDNVRAGEDIYVEFDVESAKKINPEKVTVHWATDQAGPFMEASAVSVDDSYMAVIPGQERGTEIFYFIEVEDIRGMYETLPDKAPFSGLLSIIAK
ncbi:MAG: agmatine deiminase family protein [Candidatus Muiribacteriota bacterium]